MSPSIELHPAQANLVERLLAQEHLRLALVAPAGTGKTRALLVATEHMLAADPSSTVLVVAPYGLGAVVEALRDSADGVRVHHLKGADLRLREKTSASLVGGAYFVSTGLAQRAWAREVIASLPWSLVVIDEATSGGQGIRELIDQLGAAPQTTRLCVVFGDVRQQPQIPEGLELIAWDVGQLRRLPRRTEVISFARSPEEISVREHLARIEEEFGADSFIRRTLESAWRSSTSAFEFVLARQASLLDAPHDEKRSPDPVIVARSQELGGTGIRSRWSDPDGAASALEQLAMQVADISRDSKLEALLTYIQSRLPTHKVTVFTAMRQTALYLEAALEAQDIPTSVIDGSRKANERTAREDAQVVVLTDAVVPAVDLPGQSLGVSYDLPWDPTLLDARWSTLGEIDGEAVMAILTDDSGADATEAELARKHAFISPPSASHPSDPH